MRRFTLFVAVGGLAAVLCGSRALAQQERGALGITMSDNTRGGVLIMTVVPESPAAATGLKAGDRILAVDDKPVATYREVVRIIGNHKPNSRVNLKVDRSGWTKTVSVTLSDASAILEAAPPASPPAAPPTAAPRPSFSVREGSLLSPSYLENETPADIDDQHGFGG